MKEITVDGVVYVQKSKPCDDANPYRPWVIGANYFIRTVTYHYTGKLVAVYPTELVLIDAAWIADDGRFMQAVKSGTFNEVEPFPDGANVIVGRGSIIDAVEIPFVLPRVQK